MFEANPPRVKFEEFCGFKNFMMDNFKDFDETFETQGI